MAWAMLPSTTDTATMGVASIRLIATLTPPTTQGHLPRLRPCAPRGECEHTSQDLLDISLHPGRIPLCPRAPAAFSQTVMRAVSSPVRFTTARLIEMNARSVTRGQQKEGAREQAL